MSTTVTTREGVNLQIRDDLAKKYSAVYTPEALAALSFMSQHNAERNRLMSERTQRRAARIKAKEPITFLNAESEMKGTGIKVQDARDGKFVGAVIPQDLQRQIVRLNRDGSAVRVDQPPAS